MIIQPIKWMIWIYSQSSQTPPPHLVYYTFDKNDFNNSERKNVNEIEAFFELKLNEPSGCC